MLYFAVVPFGVSVGRALSRALFLTAWMVLSVP